jgi:hypothetical protein
MANEEKFADDAGCKDDSENNGPARGSGANVEGWIRRRTAIQADAF